MDVLKRRKNEREVGRYHRFLSVFIVVVFVASLSSFSFINILLGHLNASFCACVHYYKEREARLGERSLSLSSSLSFSLVLF